MVDEQKLIERIERISVAFSNKMSANQHLSKEGTIYLLERMIDMIKAEADITDDKTQRGNLH